MEPFSLVLSDVLDSTVDFLSFTFPLLSAIVGVKWRLVAAGRLPLLFHYSQLLSLSKVVLISYRYLPSVLSC